MLVFSEHAQTFETSGSRSKIDGHKKKQEVRTVRTDSAITCFIISFLECWDSLQFMVLQNLKSTLTLMYAVPASLRRKISSLFARGADTETGF